MELHSIHKRSYAAALGGGVVCDRDICLRGERLQLMISDPKAQLWGYLSLVEDDQQRQELVPDFFGFSKAVDMLKGSAQKLGGHVGFE